MKKNKTMTTFKYLGKVTFILQLIKICQITVTIILIVYVKKRINSKNNCKITHSAVNDFMFHALAKTN